MKRGLFLCLLVVSAVAAAGSSPYLGLKLTEVGDDLKSYLGISGGALVEEVLEGSPADSAGFKKRDVVLKWSHETVKGVSDLAEKVNSAEAGSEINVTVLRKGKQKRLTVELAEPEGAKKEPSGKKAFLGIAYSSVPPWLCDYLQLGGDSRGVMVAEVLEDTPAEKAGLKQKDIILEVNGRKIKAASEFVDIIHSFKPGDEVAIKGIRAGREFTKEVTLGKRPPTLKRRAKKLPFRHRFRLPLPGEKGGSDRGGRDRMTLKFKDPFGKEHEIPLPDVPEFEMPEFDLEEELEELGPDKAEEIEKEIEQAVKETWKRVREYKQRLKDKHENFMEKLKREKGKQEGVAEKKSVIISKSTSCVSWEDGLYRITIRSEDGKKTVTVKKNGETIAEDLPYHKIETLPEDVQEKIKALEKNVEIDLKAPRGKDTPPARLPTRKL